MLVRVFPGIFRPAGVLAGLPPERALVLVAVLPLVSSRIILTVATLVLIVTGIAVACVIVVLLIRIGLVVPGARVLVPVALVSGRVGVVGGITARVPAVRRVIITGSRMCVARVGIPHGRCRIAIVSGVITVGGLITIRRTVIV
jgi:hypothetical protein